MLEVIVQIAECGIPLSYVFSKQAHTHTHVLQVSRICATLSKMETKVFLVNGID